MNEQELEKKLSQYKNVKPSTKLVHKIMADFENENKGRLSLGELIVNQIHNFMNWKIVVPVVAVVLAIIIFGGSYVIDYQNSKIYNPSHNSGAEKVFVPNPTPTADIDGIVDAVFDFSAAENNLFDDEEGDAALINMDNKVISDFGQSYDENEL